MAMDDRITLSTVHGVFETDGHHLDRAISTYLPSSASGLLAELVTLVPGQDFSGLETVSECLIVLAHLAQESRTQ